MIRKAVIEDAKTIAIIEKDNFTGFFRRKEETVKKLILNKNFEVYVFIHNGVAGYIFLQFYRGFLYIENISVSKNSQGLGIGKELMIKAEEVAKRIGYKAITLDVLKDNEKAVGLYHKFGYKTYREGKSQIKMFKKLT